MIYYNVDLSVLTFTDKDKTTRNKPTELAKQCDVTYLPPFTFVDIFS